MRIIEIVRVFRKNFHVIVQNESECPVIEHAVLIRRYTLGINAGRNSEGLRSRHFLQIGIEYLLRSGKGRLYPLGKISGGPGNSLRHPFSARGKAKANRIIVAAVRTDRNPQGPRTTANDRRYAQPRC
ncbi:hypothetical protein D3C78_1367060 [compost metagenome]